MGREGILPEPVQGPGVLRKCPSCGKKSALEFEKKIKDRVVGIQKEFRCTSCRELFRFGGKFPPRAL